MTEGWQVKIGGEGWDSKIFIFRYLDGIAAFEVLQLNRDEHGALYTDVKRVKEGGASDIPATFGMPIRHASAILRAFATELSVRGLIPSNVPGLPAALEAHIKSLQTENERLNGIIQKLLETRRPS